MLTDIPETKTRPPKRRKTDRNALQAAIADVQAGKLSLSAAAKKHDVSRSTLHRHVGDLPIERGRGPPTVLLPAEEDDLVERALQLAAEGRPLRKSHIYDIVEQIVKGDEVRRLRFGSNGRPGMIDSRHFSRGISYYYFVLSRKSLVALVLQASS